MLKVIGAALVAALLSGCASIESTPADRPGDGLVYYMPGKQIQVVVVRGDGKTTVTISPGTAYADLRHPYVLNFSRNWLGKNEMEVGVGANGLLTSTKAITTSGVGDALKGLASIAGSLKGMAAPPKVATAECTDGTYTYLFDPPADEVTKEDDCGVSVTIKRLTRSNLSAGAASVEAAPKAVDTVSPGVFYRQEEAYIVKARGKAKQPAVAVDMVVFSPSQSPVRFLPFARTFFASNKGDFTFVDGMPTKYDQEAEGELVALLKLPADVIGSYFEAIGKVFDAFKANDDKQAEALASTLKLELAKKKYDACIEAIKQKDDSALQQLGCGN